MKIAVKNNLVVLASESLEFKEGKLKDKNIPIINLTPDTCEIYDNITLPDNFRAGCFTYIDGVFEATPELQAQLDAEQAQQEQALLEQKRVEWEQEFYSLDVTMPRYAEDIIEALDNKNKLSKEAKERAERKKELRAEGKSKGYI